MTNSRRKTISARTVVITGAASGIGRALAQRLSAHACPVAIADVDEKGLGNRIRAVRAHTHPSARCA